VADPRPGEKIASFKVTPDKYLPHRYAGASGDFNPIHIDPEFAKMVGLPGSILHGLYVMGLVAKTAVDSVAPGDPGSLRKLSVQFRGMSFPEQEIEVSGNVTEIDGEQVSIDMVAVQGENQVIRNATAQVKLAGD
jgi:acyl dehydratase